MNNLKEDSYEIQDQERDEPYQVCYAIQERNWIRKKERYSHHLGDEIQIKIKFKQNNNIFLKVRIKQMFPTDQGYYVPYFFYPSQALLYANPQIFFPSMNILGMDKIQSESKTTLSSCTQIERESLKQLGIDECHVSIKKEQKQAQSIKKKIITKKSFKKVDPAEQAQWLRKKLANRPKTYQTEKKMYMKTDLNTLGIADQGRRTLRKRVPLTKKQKLRQLDSQQCQDLSIQKHQAPVYKIEESHSQNSIQRILTQQGRFQKFYDPYAKFPELGQKIDSAKQIELKKQSLLTRKIEQKVPETL